MQIDNNQKSFFNKKQIPNFLTVIRMCCFLIITAFLIINIYIVIPFYELNNPLIKPNESVVYSKIYLFHFIAGIIFVFACLTDFVDGYLARKWHCESTFGKLWDPLADKLIVNSVMIIFACQKMIPIYIPIIMVARDIIVNAYKMYAASKNVIVAADYFGKLKTVAQMFAIIFVFFIFCSPDENLDNKGKFMYYAVQNLMFYIATLLSVISLSVYIYKINKKNKTLK